MSEQTYTKAELDAAIAEAKEAQDAKNRELLNEVKALKAEVRKHKEISPDDLAALESENADLRIKLAAADKAAKEAGKAAEQATKALEAEQNAARSYALDAEINGAIAEGNIVPSLVPAFTAFIKQQAKPDLVDGKYVVQIGDKPARDHIKAFLDTDEGKAFRAAPVNGGGGAQGSQGSGAGVKQITRAQFDGMDQAARVAFAKDGGKVVDQAA